MRSLWLGIVGALLGISLTAAEDSPLPDAFDEIRTIVVIFQENRSYVHLLPDFPGASGVADAPKSAVLQRDRDDSMLPHLPPLWATDKVAPNSGHVEPPEPDPAYPTSMPNGPFFLGEPPYNTPADILTPIPVHRFYLEPDADQRPASAPNSVISATRSSSARNKCASDFRLR